jgi:hypothetical protein
VLAYATQKITSSHRIPCKNERGYSSNIRPLVLLESAPPLGLSRREKDSLKLLPVLKYNESLIEVSRHIVINQMVLCVKNNQNVLCVWDSFDIFT